MSPISPNVSEWSQEFAWFFQILTGLLTVVILILTLLISRRIQAANIRMQFQQRYDALLTPPLPQGGNEHAEAMARHHCKRFWNLQNDQFIEWQNGWLETKTFLGWMKHRLDEQRHEDWILAGDITYKRSWELFNGDFIHTGLNKFMTELFAIPNKDKPESREADNEIKAFRKEYGPLRWWQLCRKLSRRK